jgi:hypothetical protein
MRLLIETEILEEVIDDILIEEVLPELVGNPFSASRVPQSKRKIRSPRLGKSAGLTPDESPAAAKPGFLARLGRKLGLSKDWAQEVGKLSDTEVENDLLKPFDEEPPPVDGLQTGKWVPTPGDVYAYMTKKGSRALLKILGGTFGNDARGKAGLSVQRIGPGYANRGVLGIDQLTQRMRGKFEDEQTARQALAYSVASTMQEIRNRVKENLRNK